MANEPVSIDIISDVVCPWCVVGLRQLEAALDKAQCEAYISWHPFELNVSMPAEGQNLAEHVAQKYGSTAEQSEQSRLRLKQIGESLGFEFNFTQSSRIYNTFKAHQLLHWAAEQGLQHALKLALFESYFTQQQDVSDKNVLLDAVKSVGLDAAEADELLVTERYVDIVRQHEKLWIGRGVQGVPAMVFNQQLLVTGAQGIDNYLSVLNDLKSTA